MCQSSIAAPSREVFFCYSEKPYSHTQSDVVPASRNVNFRWLILLSHDPHRAGETEFARTYDKTGWLAIHGM